MLTSGDHREDGEDPDDDHDDHALRISDELGPGDVHAGHDDDDQRREHLDPDGALLPGEHGTGVAAERDRHHRGHDGVRQVDQPRGDAGEVAVAESLRDVLEHAPGARVPGAEFRERVALQPRDGPGDQERHPHRGPGHLAGRAQQREDPRAHHRPDPDERGLAHRQVLLLLFRRRRSGCGLVHLRCASIFCHILFRPSRGVVTHSRVIPELGVQRRPTAARPQAARLERCRRRSAAGSPGRRSACARRARLPLAPGRTRARRPVWSPGPRARDHVRAGLPRDDSGDVSE